MLVANNSLLNILLPQDNKVIKEVLKEADTKTLNNIKTGSTSLEGIIKNLFDDLKTGTKTNTTIENILKNSNLFKDLGNFSKSITTVLSQIDSNPELAKFKPILQNFLKDISNIDHKVLKEQISNSGIFLESKALQESKGNSNLPRNLENLLLQVKATLKDIPTLDAKKIETLIDKFLQNNIKTSTSLNQQNTTQAAQQLSSQASNLITQNSNDLKSIITLLQNLSKNVGDKQVSLLNNLTTSLKSFTSEGALLESKMSNIPTQTNQVALNNQISALNTHTKGILGQLKSELMLSNNIPNSQNIVKQIDSLLQTNNLFAQNNSVVEPKTLLNQLVNLPEIKTVSTNNTNISSLVSSLKNDIQNINTLENKVLLNQNIQNEKISLTQDINQTLNTLKNEISAIKTVDTKLVNQIIDKLLNLQNLFAKIEIPTDLKLLQQNILNQTNSSLNSTFQSNFSSNINNLVLQLKESLANLTSMQTTQSAQLNVQQTLFSNIEKLENIANNFLQIQTQNMDKLQTNTIQNDMKAVLLQMQGELAGKTDAASIETLKNIDKMIMQVEYYQLLSLTSNSNSVYMPFIWDMLDDGSISMKKINEDKFFCEINLSLKEFGQTQLMLALYDKNKLDLTIYASKKSFKDAIKESITKLKQGLNSVDLIPVNIKIIEIKEEKEQVKEEQQTNIYNQNINMGLGVDIKA